MGTTLAIHVGYGFKIPASAIERLEEASGLDYFSMYDWLEETLEGGTLAFAQATFHDYSDEDGYAIIVERLSADFFGAHVHILPEMEPTVNEDELKDFMALFEELGIKPENVKLDWLVIPSVG